MPHGDPKNPKKNPYPVKRYEITAVTDAPGPWDLVKGIIFFDISNSDCVPQDSFTGARNMLNVIHEFKMHQVDEKTWKGFFYQDALMDDDYFGLGVCHWKLTQVSPVFSVHGSNFVLGYGFEKSNPYKEYFKKSAYLDNNLKHAALDYLEESDDYIRNPSEFFAITVTVKEAAP